MSAANSSTHNPQHERSEFLQPATRTAKSSKQHPKHKPKNKVSTRNSQPATRNSQQVFNQEQSKPLHVSIYVKTKPFSLFSNSEFAIFRLFQYIVFYNVLQVFP